MDTNSAAVSGYYDSQAERKLRDFVDGNVRIERAWKTVVQWTGRPSRILEIGCGVGAVCWRASETFPSAEVVGIDISPGNLAIAERMFQKATIRFLMMQAEEKFSLGTFDVIILMDVYEHIEPGQRPRLHDNLRNSLNDNGRLILTVPTARHLSWLRSNHPSEIQPVDEDITLEVICALAREIGRDVLMYREVDIWRRGDYAHTVIGASGFPEETGDKRRSWLSEWRERLARRRRRMRMARSGLRI